MPGRPRPPLHPSYHFYTCVWGVIVGIIAALAFGFALFSHPLWLLLAVALLFVVIKLAARLDGLSYHQEPSQEPPQFGRQSQPVLLIIAFLSGLIIGNVRATPVIKSREVAARLAGRTLIISGKITETPDNSSGNTVLRVGNLTFCQTRESCHPCSSCGKPVENFSELVENSSVSVENSAENDTENLPESPAEPTEPADSADSAETAENITISGTMYVKLSTVITELERSDYITLEGKFGDGFGTFIGSMYRPQVLEIVHSEPGDIFVRFKNFFAELVREYIPSPEVDLGLGYLMGEKTGLSEDFSDRLRAVGMTHIVVASGAHLGILVALSRKIFGRISKFASLLFGLLTILGFALVVGFTPSMTRAALVAALSILVGYVGRQFTPIRLLSFVAMLTLLIVPENFGNLGWQLSFASFFAILVLSPALTSFFYGGKRPSWIAELLITSLATSLICAPILIYNFGALSLLSFAANLVILPTLPYAMLAVFLTGCASLIAPLATIFGRLTTILLGLHINLVNFLSTKTIFILTFPSANPLVFLFYIPVVIALVMLVRSNQLTYRKTHFVV